MTVGKGKYYCLGLDLEKLITLSPQELLEFSDEMQKLVGRILTFPMVTIAAINGNCLPMCIAVRLSCKKNYS